MSVRIALLPLLILGLWACGEDDDPAPVAPEPADPVLRPSGDLKPWDLSAVVPIDSVRSMPHGMPLYLRTEFANGELADLEMRFVQVVDDFLAPMPVIMVEASDPVLIQLGGIAQGMSGSPVFSEEGTWGAIAYGFNAQDSPPYYFFATPIEWVIGDRSTVPLAKPAAAWDGARITPLETPLVSTGHHGGRAAQAPPGGSFLAGAAPAGLTEERQASFEAGRPLTVGVLLGEITAAAIGTISYVDGDRVYGFGHPMSQAGAVELPIIEARVLGEISNLSAPFKFATLNPTVRGTLTEDSLPAVRGVLGDGPELVTITSAYSFPSGGEVELVHRMPARGVVQDDILSRAFFDPLYNRVDNDADHSLRVTLDVSFVETDSVVTRSRLLADPDGRLYNLIGNAYGDLWEAFYPLIWRDDQTLHVREAAARVEVIPENRFAAVVEVAADSVVSLGETLTVTASLRVGRRLDREIELALSLPDTLPAGVYGLQVGSAASLAGAPGGGGGIFGPDGFGPDDGDETLEDVFARVNEEDGNVQLKALLTYERPLDDLAGGEEASGDGPDWGFEDFLFPGGPDLPSVSTQEDVGLYLAGVRTARVKVAAE